MDRDETIAKLREHEAELKALHGMGPNAIKTLKEALAEKGWSLKEQ